MAFSSRRPVEGGRRDIAWEARGRCGKRWVSIENPTQCGPGEGTESGMFHLEMKMEPQDLLSAWRPSTSRLVLTAPAVPQTRQRAAIRMVVGKPPVTATVLGTAVGVNRNEAGRRWLELAPDPDCMAGLRLLLSAARGEPVLYFDRALRWLAQLPVVVASPQGATYMNTFSISDRGCGIVWSGPAPTMGQGLTLRFGTGARWVEFRGIVCWSASRGRAHTAGVQFSDASGAPGAWGGILAQVARSGAPRA